MNQIIYYPKEVGKMRDRALIFHHTDLDGIGVKKNVFIVGATNRPDILDEALLRPGRLDQLIYIPLPDQGSRLSILKAILRKTPIDPQVPLDFIAKLTEGFSGADIRELCNQVCKCAVKESIEFEEQKKALMKERPGEDVQMMDDPVPMLTKRHFEFGLAHCVKSVHDVDLQRYEDFKAKYDPNFSFEKKAQANRIQWPGGDNSSQPQQSSNNNDDLDLYS